MNLVTGASGLVGSHLIYHLLREQQPVRAIIRSEQSKKKIRKVFSYYDQKEAQQFLDKIEFVYGDITNIASLEDAFHNVDYVYHCAAIVSYKRSDAKRMILDNVDGTENMVNLSLKKNIKKFCHVSSIAAIGHTEINRVMNEKDRWVKEKSTSNYSYSKHYSEMEVWRAKEEGLNMVIVNPCMIVGAGDWGRSSTTFFPTVWKGLKFYPTGGTSFVDIRDLVSIMIKLMMSDITGERFIIASENLTFKAFLSTIAEFMNKSKPKIALTPLMGEIAYLGAKIKNLFSNYKVPITRESIQRGKITNFYDNSKVKSYLNFEFIPVKDSIKHTVQLFLQDQKED